MRASRAVARGVFLLLIAIMMCVFCTCVLEFEVLVERMIEDASLKRIVYDLIERKRAGEELDREPKIPELSDFIEREIERLEKANLDVRASKPETEELNKIFRESLTEAWNV